MAMFKKITLFILLASILAFTTRGFVFRSLIIYESIGQRKEYELQDKRLESLIETACQESEISTIEDVIEHSLSITAKRLKFTFEKNDKNPNDLIDSETAHCVGYAHFFTTTCNYLIFKHKLNGWKAEPNIGQLYFLQWNIHEFFSSPFFKNHDFVIIENKNSESKYAVDPTLYDYFRINYIKLK